MVLHVPNLAGFFFLFHLLTGDSCPPRRGSLEAASALDCFSEGLQWALLPHIAKSAPRFKMVAGKASGPNWGFTITLTLLECAVQCLPLEFQLLRIQNLCNLCTSFVWDEAYLLAGRKREKGCPCRGALALCGRTGRNGAKAVFVALT